LTKTLENHLACIPDSKLLVALSAPRSAFLAEKQPAGASRSLQGSSFEKAGKTPPQCNPPWRVYTHNAWIFLEFFEKMVSKALY
jgi:hypothetical protein